MSKHTHVLVVNAGSASLKVRLLDGEDRVAASLDLGQWTGMRETEALQRFVAGLPHIDAVGHRIVHGGTEFREPVVLTGRVRDRIAALSELAPLHQPRGVAGIDTLATTLPDLPAVACFDTAFHATLPDAAATYAVPAEWNRRWRLRRYGFHGLSHAYVTQRAATLLARPIDTLRIVSCHLGAGASLAAVTGGRSVDTTMGFTPLAGLVMATRTPGCPSTDCHRRWNTNPGWPDWPAATATCATSSPPSTPDTNRPSSRSRSTRIACDGRSPP
jgi:acetate kinase